MISPLTLGQSTPGGIRYVICEVILVHDCGPDRSDMVLEALGDQYSFVRPVWLSRNYGQHPATLAGMASATGDWIATIDEDGQQDPADIGCMLDSAISASLQLVYGQPTNSPPHGWLRNTLSRTVKAITAKFLGNSLAREFNSFRLVDGEIARTLAAYCSNGVYLDVGLFWVASRIGHCPVRLRNENELERVVYRLSPGQDEKFKQSRRVKSDRGEESKSRPFATGTLGLISIGSILAIVLLILG